MYNNNIMRVRLTTKIHLGFSHPIDLVAHVFYTGTASTSFGYFDILLTGARKKYLRTRYTYTSARIMIFII